MSDSVTVKFSCKKCGGAVVIPDDHTDDSIAICKECGLDIGRWGDIKAQGMEAAKADVLKRAKDIFKGFK
jgi:predicted nucleic acid-binding Zn ribbon protein